MIYCTECREEFSPIESNSSGTCSDECSEAQLNSEEFTELYARVFNGDGSPVF